jgi:mannose-6-phosphate isomerase
VSANDTKKLIRKVDKPWGYELIWGETKDYVGKLLHIDAGHKLSLQYHEIKEETIYLQSGVMDFVFEDEKGEMLTVRLNAGEAHHIPTGRKHRMIAVEDCDVFEVSTPHLDDVVRLEDGYGRA